MRHNLWMGEIKRRAFALAGHPSLGHPSKVDYNEVHEGNGRANSTRPKWMDGANGGKKKSGCQSKAK